MDSANPENLRSRGVLTGFLIAVLLALLPVAVWLDLTNLAEAALRRQATDLNSLVTSVRGYYGSNVVGRILAHPGSTQVIHNYEIGAGCHAHSRHAVAGAWQGDQRAAAEYYLSFRVRLSVQESCVASAR